MKYINMYLTILLFTVTFVLCFHVSASHARDDQDDNLAPPKSYHEEAEVQYATVKQIDTRNLRPFRKRPANVVQYQVTLDNETFTISLRPNKNLFTPGCLIHNYLPGDVKKIYPCSQERLDCYYTGSSDVHNESWVAANICNGLNGVISFGKTSLFIEPIDAGGANEWSRGKVHAVYRYHGDKKVCPVEGATTENRLHVVYGRQKRADRTRYIRTRLIVDPKMFDFHRTHNNTVAYTMMAFNIAKKLFSEQSIDTKINLILSELHIIKTYNDFASELTANVTETLREFCEWQSRHPSDADCSVLLTRIDLESNKGEKAVNGLSYPRAMCNKNRHCAVVEDQGPIVGITLAHEIGHLLGMTHDEGPDNVGIMSSGGWSGREAFTWSKQSASELQSATTSGDLHCLERPDSLIDNSYEFPLPGTIYTSDQQCKMLKNDSYVFYRDTEKNGDPCRNILCRFESNQPLKSSSPLLDGSDCNNTRTWCIRGDCVAIDKKHSALSPIDGGWSMWDMEYTSCSRSCGGGVQIKRRYCNNPPPQYGGKVCTGMSSRETICNVQACESDYRVQQCEQAAMVRFAGKVEHSWVPEFGSFGDESCLIRCHDDINRLLSSESSYQDGTECIGNETLPFSRCVNGKCVEFGCDGISDSGLKYDKCGICNGTGSTCMQHSGSYNKDNVPDIYTNVTVIPAGSSEISIQQKNMYCFLSLLVDGKRVLNSKMEKAGAALINLNGIEFRYTTWPETLEITGKITKSIVVQVLRKKDYREFVKVSPEINYTYYLPNGNRPQYYAWAEWPSETCSRSCGGTGVQAKPWKCISVKGKFVEDFHCDVKTKPRATYKTCNTPPCPARWKSSEWGKCSIPCGNGKKYRSVACVRMINDTDEVVPPINCKDFKPTNESDCSNVCEWKKGEWSECSKTCGEGYKYRDVTCSQRYVIGSEMDSKFCDQSNRSVDMQRCNHGPCYVLDGTCVDNNAGCRKYYEYEVSACDGSYKGWMMTNCPKTCGICANGSCADKPDCKKVDPTVDACRNPNYSGWMKEHCPQKCNICQDCADCSKYDVKFCTNNDYSNWMRQHCPKTCNFC